MKKNFHWLVFALVTIAFWHCGENLLFDYSNVRSSGLDDRVRKGWVIYDQSTQIESRFVVDHVIEKPTYHFHLKRCKFHRLFD